MIRNFKYGFSYKEFNYGWFKKNLYRLPSVKKKRHYCLKKLHIINIGNKKGYRIVKDRKTIEQLMELTEVINYVNVTNGVNSNDCPF